MGLPEARWLPSVGRVRGTGRTGRGERERVARRVRQTLGGATADLFAEVDAEVDAEVGRPGPLRWEPMPDVGPVAGQQHGGRRGPRARLRWDPGRRGALAMGVAAVVAALVTGAWVRSAHPRDVAIEAPSAASTAGVTVAAGGTGSFTAAPSASPAPGSSRSPARAVTGAAATAGPAATGPPLVVDVIGKVRHPGLYVLPAGARVYDAVLAAGGALRGISLDTLNLAAKVSDGQQIAVGVGGAGPAPVVGSNAGSSTAGGPSGPVNLNTATLEQLDALPGVGPVLAQHIVDWRTAHGSFGSVDQLRRVSGIGDAKFATLRPLVTV